MTVHLEFTTLFSSSLGFKDESLEIREDSTLGEVIELYLKNHPAHVRKLKEWKLFLAGKLRAIYLIDGTIAQSASIVKDNDTIKVMQAFIGG